MQNRIVVCILRKVNQHCYENQQTISSVGHIAISTWPIWIHCVPSAVMYGTPSASFKVKVTVTDDAQLPIKGLKVQKNIHNYDSLTFGITDAKGQTTLEWRDNGVIDTLRLIVKDIDGPANGTLKMIP